MSYFTLIGIICDYYKKYDDFDAVQRSCTQRNYIKPVYILYSLLYLLRVLYEFRCSIVTRCTMFLVLAIFFFYFTFVLILIKNVNKIHQKRCSERFLQVVENEKEST